MRILARGLDKPWDVQQAPGGRLVVSERNKALISVVRDGEVRTLADMSNQVWVSGETGLMSLAVDRKRRVVWACHGDDSTGTEDVRVTRMQVDRSWTLVQSARTLIAGFPTSTGRHGGCRLLLARSGPDLYIGTGDAAIGTNPQDLDSLGGKVLRVHRDSGTAMRDNPWASAPTERRFVWTYGHRNVQGLAQRADGSVWSVEHGPTVDDEVNRLVPGGNYGWNPVPGYEESVPMTDDSLPGHQMDAQWSSGDSTRATSGAAWVEGSQWGSLEGTLAVAALEDEQMMFLRFDRRGRFVSILTPPALTKFGRLRSVTSARNGDLLVTTDNGTDQVLRVSPR
ncbi:PQQ-dependent sugar dehydrogenase [Nocardioides glacieisoli]|uniref:PQQ-dependent sugar dehydrogenase n=1 Tax=Nocardioides glacieisoli TaxID=1168730 RepID=UPI002413E640|nr:PQQ-dependent sugar dehydrogenase [Nocardioides glacieisoli]